MTESNQVDQARADLLPLSGWLVNALRLTAFPHPPTGGDLSSWWLDVIEEQPDGDTAEPKLGRRRLESSFEGGKLTLAMQPGRIDWRFSAAEPDFETSEISHLGPLPRTLEVFRGITSRWFETESYPTVLRLAFGAVLLYPVDSRELGYQQLDRYLPSVQLDPADSSDFLYQINRPRDSALGIPALRINRLSKWSVFRGDMTRFIIGPAGPTMESRPAHYACRLELDINTVSEFREGFDQEQSSRIFHELIDLGQEIISRGDIP
jgi:hypothetical protein